MWGVWVGRLSPFISRRTTCRKTCRGASFSSPILAGSSRPGVDSKDRRQSDTVRSEEGGWPCSVTGSFRVGQCPKPKSGPLCRPPNRFQPIRHDALRLRSLCFSGKGKAGQHPPLWVCTEWGRAGLSSSLCSCFGLRVAGLPGSLLPRKHSHWIWHSR